MNSLFESFSSDLEYQRLKELKDYFQKNSIIKDNLKALFKLQKTLVLAKVERREADVIKLEKAYKELETKLLEYPFVDEYFSLLSDLKLKLEILKESLETKFADELGL